MITRQTVTALVAGCLAILIAGLGNHAAWSAPAWLLVIAAVTSGGLVAHAVWLLLGAAHAWWVAR